MRLVVKSHGTIQIHTADFVRESKSTDNLRIHNPRGISQYIVMPDIATRERVLIELATKGFSFVNSDDASETQLSFTQKDKK